MLSYTTYKILHLFAIIVFSALAGVSIAKDGLNKVLKISIGVSSLVILVTGMGLLARVGVSHSSGLPLWVTIKMMLWLVLAGMFGYISKKGIKDKSYASAAFAILTLGALFMAVFKPF